jgi:hypothetical protein
LPEPSLPKEKIPSPVRPKVEEPVRVARETAKVPSKREEIPPIVRVMPKKGGESAVFKPTPVEPTRSSPPVGGSPILPAKPAELAKPAQPEPPRPAPAVVPVPEPAPKRDEPAKVVSEVPKEILPPPAKPAEMAKVDVVKPATPPEPPRPSPSVAPVTTPSPKLEEPAKVIKEVPRVTSLEPLAKEEEVKEFFARYVEEYNRKDIGSLISFFSPRVVQNQKYGFNDIIKMYSNFFNESQELAYRVKIDSIEINPIEAKIAGTYILEQIPKGGKAKLWRGNIQWTLIQERGMLKIRTLRYQHTKP